MRKIADIYRELEGKRTLNNPDFEYDLASFAEEDQPAARMEILTWWNMDMVDTWVAVSENKSWNIAYLKKRVESTSNQILQYRYNLFLFALTKDNRFASKSIDAIMDFLPSFLLDDDKLFSSYADRAIGDLLKLSKGLKDKRTAVTKFLMSILDSSSGYATKIEIITRAKEFSFFGKEDAPRIVETCKSLFPECRDGWRVRCCELGLYYAAKLQKEGAPYAAFFNESLGDIEISNLFDVDKEPNNIILPHYNHSCLAKAIRYYQLAGANEKLLDAQKQYREIGSRLRYLHYYQSVPTNKKLVNYFSKFKKRLLESKPGVLFYCLVTLDGFLLPPKLMLEKWTKEHSSKDEALQFASVRVDINDNSHKESEQEHELLFFYDTWVKNILRQSIMDVILSAIGSGQLTYGKLRRQMLIHSSFSAPKKETESFSCCWFARIDFALKDLFRQYKRFMAGKPADWRIPIDVLPAKFEGMLRDVVSLEGGQTKKIGKNGELTEALLDDLLRDPVLKSFFSDEDILFFEYVFTSKGENIRNNVAHGFYKPCHYDIYKATLVFLCILRLAKYSPTG